VYFFSWSIICVGIGVQLFYEDRKTGSVLDDTITTGEEGEKQREQELLNKKKIADSEY